MLAAPRRSRRCRQQRTPPVPWCIPDREATESGREIDRSRYRDRWRLPRRTSISGAHAAGLARQRGTSASSGLFPSRLPRERPRSVSPVRRAEQESEDEDHPETFKQRVRARSAETDESYTAARAQLLRRADAPAAATEPAVDAIQLTGVSEVAASVNGSRSSTPGVPASRSTRRSRARPRAREAPRRRCGGAHEGHVA